MRQTHIEGRHCEETQGDAICAQEEAWNRRSLPHSPQKDPALPTPDLRLLASYTERWYLSAGYTPSLWSVLQQPCKQIRFGLRLENPI